MCLLKNITVGGRSSEMFTNGPNMTVPGGRRSSARMFTGPTVRGMTVHGGRRSSARRGGRCSVRRGWRCSERMFTGPNGPNTTMHG